MGGTKKGGSGGGGLKDGWVGAVHWWKGKEGGEGAEGGGVGVGAVRRLDRHPRTVVVVGGAIGGADAGLVAADAVLHDR